MWTVYTVDEGTQKLIKNKASQTAGIAMIVVM